MRKLRNDIKQVDQIAREMNVDRHALGQLVHIYKKGDGRGPANNLTPAKIREIASELPRLRGRQ